MRQDASGWLAAAGALLFMVSDSVLAVRQFRGPYPRAQALILSTYWLAIALVAAAAVNAVTLAPQSAGEHHKAVAAHQTEALNSAERVTARGPSAIRAMVL